MKKPILNRVLSPLMWSICLMGVGTSIHVGANEPLLIDLGAELESMEEGGGEKSKPQTMTTEPPKLTMPTMPVPQEVRVDKGGNVIAERATGSNTLDHAAHKHGNWSYSGQEGPRYWGELSPENKPCKAGKNQSPINLKDKTALSTVGLPALDIYYRDVPLKVIHKGNTLQVNYPLGSYIKLGTARYELLQFHFHTPSEHQKDGFNYPMEAHLVHKDGEGNFAILGVIFQEGEENPALNILLKNLPKKMGKLEVHRRASLNPARFLPGNTEFYKYSGSLTKPPCTEGVIWMVFKQPIDASAEQLHKLNEIMGNNARPIQENYARSLLKSWLEPTQQPEVLPYEFY